jgi:membrane fusion protein, heavy metal efflux system
MLATMEIRNQRSRQTVVPMTAVVRESDQEHVFVQVAQDTFALRPVKLGEEFDKTRALIEGVRAEEKIVVEGAFHLNNERRRRAISGCGGGDQN